MHFALKRRLILTITLPMFAMIPPEKMRTANAADGTATTKPFVENKAEVNRLRKGGFLFLELNVFDVAGYTDFFQKVAGYEPVRIEAGFAILHTEAGEILLNGSRKTAGHGLGAGVEIGIVVADLDQSFAAVKTTQWRISDGIHMQPWGVRDFRVFAPDGYYIRITEGPKE